MRCPFRMRAFDHPDKCDPRCAWLMEDMRDSSLQCAVAMMAEKPYTVPVNRIGAFVKEKDDD